MGVAKTASAPSSVVKRSALLCLVLTLGCSTRWRASSDEHPVTAEQPAELVLVAQAPTPESRETRVSEPGGADLDPDKDDVIAPPDPIADCEARLNSAGIVFSKAALPVHARGGIACGTEQAVVYESGPGRIRYNGPPIMTCGMALALGRFELMLQQEAERRLGKRVTRIEQGGTYNCRKMARFKDMVSEHSYANAIDLRSFTLQDGRRISVLRQFGPVTSEGQEIRSAFLRNVARRAYDEGLFSVVLTPFFDSLHRDHFHLDLARYRLDGTR